MSWSGAPFRRLEDRRLVTGGGRYTGGLRRDGLLHCHFVRSTLAHAEVAAMSLDDVRVAPGVVAALTAADLELADIPGSTGRGPGPEGMARPVLARDRVRHAGEPVAVIVARSAAEAVDAAALVELDLVPLEVVADPERALADRVLLFPEAGTNLVAREVVPDAAELPDLDRWPVSVEIAVTNQRLAPVPIEPLVVLAEPDHEGGVVVWCGHQAPHRLRDQLAHLLDLPPSQVRVRVPDVGGGFGLRGMLFPEYAVVAALARRLDRPVRWAQTRTEQFLGGTHGRGQRHRVRLAGDESGRIHAAEVEILADLGAYPHNGSHVPLFTRYMATGPYDIRDVRVTTSMVVTNLAPIGSYRGAGRPEAAFALERAVDAFARRLGADPAEVRRRNLIPPEAMPYRTVTGALYDGGDYAAALERALALADVAAVREEQERRHASGANPIGVGIGMFVERAGGAVDSSEYVRVELDGGGRPVARVGSTATGQGHETLFSQLLADVFDVAPDDVAIVAGDTAAVRAGTGSFASRSTQIAGSAVQVVGTNVREHARRIAATLLEIDAEDTALTAGRFHPVGAPARSVTLAEVAAHAARTEVELAAEEVYSPHAQTFPYGATVAVVEVDPDTGAVALLRLATVDDVGNVLNPLLVEGQVHGSLLQGVAQALYEGIVYDDEGQLLTSSLVDYTVPAATEAPDYVTGRLVTPAPSNPLGAKGAGESGCLGAPPAIVNATIDALADRGVTDLAMPLTPERVWRALEAGRRPDDPAPDGRREPATASRRQAGTASPAGPGGPA